MDSTLATVHLLYSCALIFFHSAKCTMHSIKCSYLDHGYIYSINWHFCFVHALLLFFLCMLPSHNAVLPIRILQYPDKMSILNLSRHTYVFGGCIWYNSVTQVYCSKLGIPRLCSKDIHSLLLVRHYVLPNKILAKHLLICPEISDV